MKNTSTTRVLSRGLAAKSVLVAAAILMTMAGPMGMMAPIVKADKYDDQINALKQEIGQYQAEANRLRGEANTLQAELARLNSEKAVIQNQIDISEAKLTQLRERIAETEKKIKDNQNALGYIIAELYVDDTVSPLEMIASSKNLGDYLDKQEYRTSVRDELSTTIATIKQLKEELETQKKEAERVLADQQAQRQVLVQKENEQAALLNQTRGQEAAYQQLSSAKNAEISKLRSQQAAEIAARARSTGGYTTLPGDGSRGGYPSLWANAPMNAYVDSWGMYSRQCVSYTAFKVDQAYGNMPYWGGIGNANQWGNNARNSGIKVSSIPSAGTVGVLYDGPYGHVAWVESVNANGTINISHYNVGWGGEYAEWYNVSPRFFQEYIYFGG
jgi:surface antigen